MQTRGNVLQYGEEKISLKNLGRRLKVSTITETKKKQNRTREMCSERLEKKRKSDQVNNMVDERIWKRAQNNARNNERYKRSKTGQGESSEERTPNVNGDARKYLEHYNGKTQMWICAVCGSEEGECDLKLLEDIPPAVFAQSDLSALFTRAVSSAVGDNTFHQAFVNSIRAEFHPTGLLKSAKHVCKICLKQLRREKFVQVGSNGVDECADDVENDESDDDEEDDEVSEHEEEIGTSSASPLNVPTAAYLQGLYPGVIPPELADLRTVELSMVSIYNPITRLQLNCKGVTYKYFHGKANAYTIVNDVTNVASVLPQLPNVQTLAILRYTNDVCTKDLKYRPGMVKRALEWLKRNLESAQESEPSAITVNSSARLHYSFCARFNGSTWSNLATSYIIQCTRPHVRRVFQTHRTGVFMVTGTITCETLSVWASNIPKNCSRIRAIEKITSFIIV